MNVRDLVIVGAGPAGLAAAIAAKQAGLDYLIVEKGVLVHSIFRFPPHMVFFTTPELLEIGGLPLVSPYEKPTRLEVLRYYRRVVDAYDLNISCLETVAAIRREEADGQGPVFALETRPASGAGRTRLGRAVILAIGYYDHPNRLGIPGEDLPHVSHYYSEPHPYYRRPVVIVGGGNSAAEAALDLYRGGAHVTLVHYRDALKESIKYWVRPDIENRIREQSIAARFRARALEIRPASIVVEQEGRTDELPADAVFLLTGYHPDYELMRAAGVEVDDQTGVARYDPSTLETNVPGLFIAGGAVSGRDTAPIFIENGRYHGEQIVRTLASRLRPQGPQP